MKINSLLVGMGMMAAATSHGKIYLDHEEHPIPLVDITVVLPVGFEAKTPGEAGAANLLSDMLENGTAKLNRQAFLDKLAAYGASVDFTVSNQFSFWKLSFPVVAGQDYTGLADVLAENWSTPRFTQENFDIARQKLAAALSGGLDNDMALGISTARRFVNKRDFGGYPMFLESLSALTLPVVKNVFERDFQKSPEIWVGVIGPLDTTALVRAILTKVFPNQGEIIAGQHLQKLNVAKPADVSNAKHSMKALIIDKPDRNQTVTSLIAVQPSFLSADDEIAFMFGNHILVDSGLGSVFGEEIRNKRGLAYAVSPVSPYYLGLPVVGFASNPVRPKTAEAFQVISGLLKSSYETGTVFKDISDEVWNRQWKSFRYSRILEDSTPMGRLSERMSVITGTLTPKLYQTPIEKWDASRDQIQKRFKDQWSRSVTVLSVVGDAAELKPMVQKDFPAFDVKVIPYKDTIHASAY